MTSFPTEIYAQIIYMIDWDVDFLIQVATVCTAWWHTSRKRLFANIEVSPKAYLTDAMHVSKLERFEALMESSLVQYVQNIVFLLPGVPKYFVGPEPKNNDQYSNIARLDLQHVRLTQELIINPCRNVRELALKCCTMDSANQLVDIINSLPRLTMLTCYMVNFRSNPPFDISRMSPHSKTCTVRCDVPYILSWDESTASEWTFTHAMLFKTLLVDLYVSDEHSVDMVNHMAEQLETNQVSELFVRFYDQLYDPTKGNVWPNRKCEN